MPKRVHLDWICCTLQGHLYYSFDVLIVLNDIIYILIYLTLIVVVLCIHDIRALAFLLIIGVE